MKRTIRLLVYFVFKSYFIFIRLFFLSYFLFFAMKRGQKLLSEEEKEQQSWSHVFPNLPPPYPPFHFVGITT